MAEPSDMPTLPAGLPPDIMNDPQYATNIADGEDGGGDMDTCRICRGEGSDTEPLFHPCKCSGSIKHVHQDCLMEWLSHSQKKHCELCKTPFRFTKLYSPNMPQSLPHGIFLHHFVLHLARNITTWLRLCLVSTVWLGCLPFLIRQVWRVLFWFSDGGWPSPYMGSNLVGNLTTQTMEIAHQFELAIMAGNGTSPVTPLSAAQTTSASIGGIVEAIIGALKPLSSAMNVSSADPLVTGFMNVLYYGLGLSDLVFPDETFFTNTSDPRLRSIMGLSPAVNRTSILSEYSFLSNMTRNPTLNHLIVAIAEGYIITVAVVFVFILVFLIREWVVQQQPGINMGAGFNAEFPGDRPVRGQRDQAVQADHHNAPARLARPAIENEPEVRDVGNRPMARVRRRNTEIEAAEHAELRPGLHDSTNVPARPQNREALGQNRPAPVRDALGPATDIQRRLTEEPRMTEEFLAIWRRANGIPDDVLRLINEENKAEEMRYWVNAMEGIKKNSSRTDGSGAHDTRYSGPSVDSFLPSSPNNSTGSPVVRPGSSGGMGGSDSWVDVAKTVSYRKANTVLGSGDQKEEINSSEASEMASGKGKAKEIPKESLDPATQLLLGMDFTKTNQALGHPDRSSNSPFPHNSPRPRAISDAPHKRDSIAPFGRDNWSFSHLDKENVDPSTSSRFDLPDVGSSKSAFDPTLKSYLAEDETPERLASKAAQDPYVRASCKGREAEEAQKSNLGSEFGVSEPTDTGMVGSTTAEDFDEAMNRPVKVVGQDGISRTYENVHEMFEANLVSASDSREDEHAIQGAQLDPVIPDTPLPEPREPTLQRAPDPQGFLGNVADFLWGQIEEDQGADDERVIQDLAAEAPFVPVGHHDHFEQAEEPPEQDREFVEAANVAGLDPNDPEAIEDAEDFEGIMELIGMRGPIFSLVQNALFCALLLALTVAFGVWIPYNIGRVSLLLAANPGPAFKLPLRLVFWCAAFLQDLAVSVIGLTSYLTILIVSVPLKAFFSSASAAGWSAAALRISNDAVNRILDGAITNIINFSETEMFTFSAASHEALLTLKYLIIDTLDEIGRNVIYLFIGDYQVSLAGFGKAFLFLMIGAHKLLSGFLAFITNPENWVISLEVAKRSTPLDLELSIWGGWDRFWAVLSGYTALSVLGALYVKKGTPFSNGQVGREWEATIIDLLHQAGGVLKVILIISIEMLVFPLYCGLLLDAALLPLFEGATIVSRILFTFNSPFTSIFVHWFVGTCYMFHFALFVSMCRKIMRKGVLYFIRDPDDPTFHPVRDVLERNVSTQLRKILFSALVYGALVVICLGGVVWGISYTFNGVLPIHWSSNEPVLEFPIDLLFYNFLMPLAVRFFKPSDGLHTMYSWWFRQCARMLRLTWFMFDERKLDEEGYHVRRTWGGVLRGIKGDPDYMIKTSDPRQPFIENTELSAYFRQDGRYVRAPASDQVRIPKGTEVFLEVDELNNRIDGEWDRPDGVHGRESDLYKQVYIPPHFRLRIGAFILAIWIFAALTGVCITLVPLVFGRAVFAKIIPSHVRKNDVYAFSIGIYILGSVLYAVLHLRPFVSYIVTSFSLSAETPRNILRRGATLTERVARILWTYGAFIFILPTLFAFLVEFYAILPLHTYFAPGEPHTIHFVQSWTLGLLYVKLTTRLILLYSESRPAISLRAITRNGYLNPDARLATRSFIFPAAFSLSLAISWPWLLARIALTTIYRNVSEEEAVLVYRYVYPAVLAAALCVCVVAWLVRCLKVWRMRIRDDVYLIGERLHNFGDRKSGGSGVGVVGVRRIET